MEQKKTEYKSCFSESIENLVNEKKSLGYAYKFQSEIFAKFDKFCIDNKINSECITHIRPQVVNTNSKKNTI